MVTHNSLIVILICINFCLGIFFLLNVLQFVSELTIVCAFNTFLQRSRSQYSARTPPFDAVRPDHTQRHYNH
jgi:hypothetical protein